MTIKALTEAEIREEKLVLVREARRIQGDLNDVLGKMAQAGVVVSIRCHGHEEIGVPVSRLFIQMEMMERL